MLELKKLSKTYRPKKGVPVQALKNISLTFEDNGMVFVQGKSGSGKSTLLNIIGGLDIADGGEMSIDGKTTRYFKPSDYDSYRNTYIGFVFQEYNLLDDFTVGENISLALELQNEKVDKNLLDKILKEVELEGYADRKINELSGGQKQRVAIARALIKNPKIIMADEPTGALDSSTGKAILDTLKRLSQEKLVIVVSHDREFAQEYGDRVIELADGEVVDDYQLSQNNFTPIQTQQDSNFIRSRLPFVRALKMGVKTMAAKPIRLCITILLCIMSFAFFGIADTLASYSKNKMAINSILNNKYDTLAITSTSGALDMDIPYLKDKTGIDFLGAASFGDASGQLSILYPRKVKISNGAANYYNTALRGYLPAEKVLDGVKYKFIAGAMPKSANEIVVSKYTYEQFALGGIRLVDGLDIINIEPEEISTAQDFVNKAYIQTKIQDDAFITWKVVGVVDTLEDPQGRYAQLKPSSQDNEMTSQKFENLSMECAYYFAYSYHSVGFVSQDTYDKICALSKDDTLLGSPAKGSISLRKKSSDGKGDTFVNSFISVLNDTDIKSFDITWTDGIARATLKDNELIVGANTLADIGKEIPQNTLVELSETYFDGIVDFSSIKLSLSTLKEYAGLFIGAFEYAEKIDNSHLNIFKEFINGIGSNEDEETAQTLRGMAILNCLESAEGYLSDFSIDPTSEDFTDAQWKIIYAGYLMTPTIDFYDMIDDIEGGYIANVIPDQLSGKEIEIQFGKQLYSRYLLKEISDMDFDELKVKFVYGREEELTLSNSPKIVGVYTDTNLDNNQDVYIFNKLVYAEAQKALTPNYEFLIAPMTSDKKVVKTLVNMHFDESAQRPYYMQNSVAFAFEKNGGIFDKLGKIFLYVGIGLALFSIVLMSNYIALSISSKKKQIGILRALGAKTGNIFTIFYVESFMIAIINFVFATIAGFAICLVLGTKVASDLGLQITFFSFGIRQVAIILCISIAVAVIASLIPIYRLSKKKPIDCIQDR